MTLGLIAGSVLTFAPLSADSGALMTMQGLGWPAISLQPLANRLTGHWALRPNITMRELIKMPKGAHRPELVELVRLLRKQWANQRGTQSGMREMGKGLRVLSKKYKRAVQN